MLANYNLVSLDRETKVLSVISGHRNYRLAEEAQLAYPERAFIIKGVKIYAGAASKKYSAVRGSPGYKMVEEPDMSQCRVLETFNGLPRYLEVQPTSKYLLIDAFHLKWLDDMDATILKKQTVEEMPVSHNKFYLSWRGDEVTACEPRVEIYPENN